MLFDIERGINGLVADERRRVRKEQSAPLVTALEAWLREERARLSRSASVVEPIDYMLKRWDRFARFIDDGRICLTNTAERALRGFAMRESLCTPSSSVCKHWKRVRVDNATRTTFPGHRRFDRFDLLPATSGLPQSTDVARPARLVRYVPTCDIALAP
jgi:transposase